MMEIVRSDFLTGGITLAAIILFVGTGSAVMPAAVQAMSGLGTGANRMLVTTLLLNLALIVFGWRRCHDLQREIIERKAAEQRAQELASRDPLTGLLNRRSLTETAYIDEWSQPSRALLLVDLDHFKNVNDLHGHAIGDGLLRKVAEAIRECTPPRARCARLGGDEFAILLTGPHSDPEAASSVAATIIDRLSQPFEVDGIFAHVAASIGISTPDAADASIEALLRRSDIAMYEAKRSGRNCFAWFDRSMESELRRRTMIEAGIRSGIPAGEFVPYFEPQIDLVTGRISGFEVLARWHHPNEGVIGPDEFIPIAEATGLISSLSNSVMRQALLESKSWDDRLTIAVNIAPVQLKDPLLAQKIVQILAETGFPARRLEIEITESSLFENMNTAKATIESLKNQGIRIALDDFGTGYSSLSHLQALPFDRIKIDRSFIVSLGQDSEKLAIVNAIIRLGNTLGLPVTAEGIEDAATSRSARALGCAGGQGWHFGRPMPGEQARAMFEEPRAARCEGPASGRAVG